MRVSPTIRGTSTMKDLTKSSPSLETVLQAILYRVYSENKTVEEVINTIDPETWIDIGKAIAQLDDRDIIKYITKVEHEATTAEANTFEQKEKMEIRKLKVWLVKTVVRTLLSILVGLTAYMAFATPDEISEVIKHLLSLFNDKLPSGG